MVSESMKILGLMSGTSLDGLDLALVDFMHNEGKYSYNIVRTKAVSYSKTWYDKLKNARFISAVDLQQLHVDYGVLLAEEVMRFGIEGVDLISSHGHTVFHQPEKGFTLQIGDLNQIAVRTGVITVGDFRSLDVAKGGQGAPLVPIGDQLLFAEFESCLNLGGIANVSVFNSQQVLAGDIAPCNIVSNYLSNKLGYNFDENGDIGRKGKLNSTLQEQLASWHFYKNEKSSLGIEDIEKDFLPMFNSCELSIADQLHTYYHHLAKVIGSKLSTGKTFCTGGGVKNLFLIELLRKYSKSEIIVPSEELIDFKEAIIFGFLGFLRMRGDINTLKSVTGAYSDSCSGIIIKP